MHLLRSMRWFLLALLIVLVPLSSQAGIFISVGFAPPVLPVYMQPDCPEAGLMWTPGYWSYGPDGYFWVPGAWVPAPYEGALWTPPYWGWSGGLFVFHDGYWGRHVGYYGGVNYGFGYGGIGFAGGMWRGHEFAYNTAVMHVDNRFIHTTYVDRDVVNRYTVARDSRVAYSGGPGGIQHAPAPEERAAERESHVAKTSFQAQHESAARSDRTSYVKNNGGRPAHVVAEKPLGAETHTGPAGRSEMQSRPGNTQSRPGTTMRSREATQSRPTMQSRPTTQSRPGMESRPQRQSRPETQSRPERQSRPETQSRPAMQSRPAQSSRPAQNSRPAQASHPEPASHGGGEPRHK
jgi:hypothetical protein